MARAHPRSRGENLIVAVASRDAPGSSPLTRGKPGRGLGSAACAGLIPAHAGKTSTTQASTSTARAHPRSRGENYLLVLGSCGGAGSSPLTRGKLSGIKINGVSLRLIPAHAGKTSGGVAAPGRVTAHPRSRGENRLDGLRRAHRQGSSPLTRGKRVFVVRRAGAVGLIPAHAGKTARGHASLAGPRAHPRSRGENSSTSPPRAGRWLAHPRSRGENRIWRDNRLKVVGSSPLTRGKR